MDAHVGTEVASLHEPSLADGADLVLESQLRPNIQTLVTMWKGKALAGLTYVNLLMNSEVRAARKPLACMQAPIKNPPQSC